MKTITRCYKLLSQVLAVWLFSLLIILSVGLQAQTGPINIDGNPHEWPTVLPPTSPNTYPPEVDGAVFVRDERNSSVDDQLAQQAKDVNDIGIWHWTLGNTNDKTDISNAGAAIITEAGVTHLCFFGDRLAPNGDANIGFWLLLDGSSPYPTNPPDNDQGMFTPPHNASPGDILILTNFLNGGGNPTYEVWQWTPTGIEQQFPGIPVIGNIAVNSQEYPVPSYISPDGDIWEFTSKNGVSAYETGLFVEGCIDLTNLINFGYDLCNATCILETRNSQSITAQLGDFAFGDFDVEPEPPDVTGGEECADVNGEADVTLCATTDPGNEINWYDAYPLVTPIATQIATVGPDCITVTITQNTTYYVTVTNSLGCISDTAEVQAKILPGPPCGISGPSPVCPNSLNTYSFSELATDIASFAWTVVSGDATIPGSTDGSTVDVLAGSTCNSTFIIQVTIVDNNGCVNTCTYEVTIEDNIDPVLNDPPADEYVECAGDQTPMIPLGWTDNCDGIGAVIGTEVSDGETCPETLTRTWTYTDACGNSDTKVQYVYIEDVTDPVIADPPDYTFECCDDQYIPIPPATDNCYTGTLPTIPPYFYFTRSDGKPNWTDPYDPAPDPYTTIEYLVTIWYYDDCGNVSEEEFTVTILPCGTVQCTYTQGFYGNPGGATCDGTFNFLSTLIGDPLTVGVISTGNYFTFNTPECVWEYLPGGGPSIALTGDGECTNIPDPPPIPFATHNKKGTAKNTLFVQTVTLALNIRANENADPTLSLGNMPLNNGELWIAGSEDCQYGPIDCYYSLFGTIDSEVITELNANYTNTVQGLLDLANDALAGVITDNLDEIAEAAALINEGFDECAYGYFGGGAVIQPDGTIIPPSVPSSPGSDPINNATSTFLDNTTLKASPNPFSELANIEFTIPMTVRVSLEVYTLQGQHVETLYTGMAEENVIHTYQFYAKGIHNQSVYVYVLKTIYGTKVGKMIMIK